MNELLQIMRLRKHFYLSHARADVSTEGLNEDSSWLDILLRLQLSNLESPEMSRRANAFVQTEMDPSDAHMVQCKLPYHIVPRMLLSDITDADLGDHFEVAMTNGDMICFDRYPKLSEIDEEDCYYNFPIVVATIKTSKIAEFPDFDFSFEQYDECGFRHLIVRYERV